MGFVKQRSNVRGCFYYSISLQRCLSSTISRTYRLLYQKLLINVVVVCTSEPKFKNLTPEGPRIILESLIGNSIKSNSVSKYELQHFGEHKKKSETFAQECT